jgi:formylmethanofuran dehydrogenase subunit E
MRPFEDLLEEAVAAHGHKCAGQVLGVRMAMRGLRELSLDADVRTDRKRLIVYVEIDRCAADAVASVTGCRLGKRTLKYVDYGKVAATFVDTETGRAVRVLARDEARELVDDYVASNSLPKYEAQLQAYQVMAEDELFVVTPVTVEIPIEDRPGRPISRVTCEKCGEGINDAREVNVEGRNLCRACAGKAYYREAAGPPLRDGGG